MMFNKLFFLIVGLLLMTYQNDASEGENPKTLSVIRSSNIVSNIVYKILAKDDINVLFCPLGFNTLLSMVTAGARGKTAEELRAVLHYKISDEDIKSGYKELLKGFKINNLILANRGFLKSGMTLMPGFSEMARTHFGSDIKVIDFTKPKAAGRTINSFVREKTNKEIYSVVYEDNISIHDLLVLVDAVLFKNNWLLFFNYTTDLDFHVTKTEKLRTTMMKQTSNYLYKEISSLDAKVILIPFQDMEYNMIIILPNAIDGIHKVENKLASTNFEEILNNLKKTEKVSLTIPEFRMEVKIDLKTLCEKIGIKSLFTYRAELKGLVKESTVVTGIIQKTYINVNKYGVTATAPIGTVATGYKVSTQKGPLKQFNANHPFVFMIMHKNLIIFQGRLFKP